MNYLRNTYNSLFRSNRVNPENNDQHANHRNRRVVPENNDPNNENNDQHANRANRRVVPAPNFRDNHPRPDQIFDINGNRIGTPPTAHDVQILPINTLIRPNEHIVRAHAERVPVAQIQNISEDIYNILEAGRQAEIEETNDFLRTYGWDNNESSNFTL